MDRFPSPFRCELCGAQTEKRETLVRKSAPPLTVCPACLERHLAALHSRPLFTEA